MRQTRWAAYALRSRNTGRPCVGLVDIDFGGTQRAFSVQTEIGCARGDRFYAETAVIKAGYTYQRKIGAPVVTADAFAAALPSTATNVVVELQPGSNRSFAPRVLSERQARKARVEPFGYVLFDIARQTCIESLVATDSSGSTVAEEKSQC